MLPSLQNQIDNNTSRFKTLLGYNPFIATKKENARLGKSIINSYRFYFDMITLLCMSRFKWENIPIEIPQYQLEKCLFYGGMAGITFDDIAEKFVILPVVYTSRGLNMYGEPKSFTLFSYSSAFQISNIQNYKDGVICYNNNLKDGNLFLTYRYSQRLQLIDDIIDMNVDKQRTPYIIICPDEKERISLKQFLEKIELNTGAVFARKDFTKENIITLDLRVELKAEELLRVKREIFNEACLYLGLTSNLSNKKERLISSEVASESKRYDIYREIGLQPRKYFCQQVKKIFNLDIDVSYIGTLTEEIENVIIDPQKEEREEKAKTIKKAVE